MVLFPLECLYTAKRRRSVVLECSAISHRDEAPDDLAAVRLSLNRDWRDERKSAAWPSEIFNSQEINWENVGSIVSELIIGERITIARGDESPRRRSTSLILLANDRCAAAADLFFDEMLIERALDAGYRYSIQQRFSLFRRDFFDSIRIENFNLK